MVTRRREKRIRPYARIFTTIKNHHRTIGFYGDNDLMALFTRILIEGVERYADRNDDTMHVSNADLMELSGKHRIDVARKSLERLADFGAISIEHRRDFSSIVIRNFAKRQGLGTLGLSKPSQPTSSSSSTSSTIDVDPPEPPSEGGPKKSKKAKGKTKKPKRMKPQKIRDRELSIVHAKEAWPGLVEHAAQYGRHWPVEPSEYQIEKMVMRIEEGATTEMLHHAIDGFVSLMQPDKAREGDRDMMKWLRATTLYRPTKFLDYVEEYEAEGAKSRAKNWLARDVQQTLAAMSEMDAGGKHDGAKDSRS